MTQVKVYGNMQAHLLWNEWKSLSCVWLFATPWANTVHGILQNRILEWVAIPFSRGSSQPRNRIRVSFIAAAAAAKSLQSCPTLCNPIDGSPPGFSVHGILQARTLEWVAISFSNAWKWKVKVKSLSRVWLLATPWTAAHQAPPSMGFSRQEYRCGLPLPTPKELLTETYFNISLLTNFTIQTLLIHLLNALISNGFPTFFLALVFQFLRNLG